MKDLFLFSTLTTLFIFSKVIAIEDSNNSYIHYSDYFDQVEYEAHNYVANLKSCIYNTKETRSDIIFSHTSFEDFSNGTVSNSGHNLFVSRDGQIRFINWFDLNNDGHPEIVVVNDHDHYEKTDGFIYYNTPGKGFRSLYPPVHKYIPGFQKLEWIEESSKYMKRLPSLGGGRTLVEDLNGNGYPEILFTNFIHGWSSNHFPVYIYWGDEQGYELSRMSYLPSLSASGLAAADLNGNGRKDLIMANGGREYVTMAIASASYFEGERISSENVGYDEGTSYIYWQEPYGYTIDNRSELPTEFAHDVAVADLNKDGMMDVIFLQGSGSLRIFYGIRKDSVPEFKDIKVLAPVFWTVARQVLIADLNNNGWLDVFVPSEGDLSEIFWNGPDGISENNRSLVASRNALAAGAADLTQNGYNDLVIVNNIGDSYVYWGSSSGFTEDNRMELPTNGATGVKIADLNNNGFLDIVFSNSLEGESFDTPSFIYWGSKNGYHPADRDELMGYGAVDVSVGDFNGNGLNDIFLMNRQSGTRAPQFGADTYSPVDLFVFWGNSQSRYSVASMSALPGVTGQSCILASDITGNGYADMVYTTNRGRILNVFYGNSQGFCKESNLQINLPFRGNDVLAADLNKNGYLDIIVGSRNSDEFAVIKGKQDGFEDPIIFDFGMLQFTAVLGDIDGDGRLDLVLGGHGNIKILYGTDNGLFDRDKTQTIETGMFTRRISLADFNGNGSLDIFGHHFSKAHQLWENNVFSAIYWNHDGMFSAANRLELPSHGAHSGTVADINRNGNIDILIANYNSQFSRNLETFIYWGDAGGNYSTDRMTGLPGYSPVANIVLDLNGNGINDIVVFNHSKSDQYAGLQPLGGVHASSSFIYWGSEEGWNIKKRDQIPSIGPHSRLIAEPGDIMRRGSYEEYISTPVPVGNSRGNFILKVGSEHNFRQNIKVFIKSAESPGDLNNKDWTEISLKERLDDHFIYEGRLGRGETYIQYMLRLDTGGTGTGPVVHSVEMIRN